MVTYLPGDPTGTAVWHGTSGGYTNHKCRCTRCRRAWAAYVAKRKAERQTVPPYRSHGVYTTYTNYNCRCSLCKIAHKLYSRGYYARKKEKDALRLRSTP